MISIEEEFGITRQQVNDICTLPDVEVIDYVDEIFMNYDYEMVAYKIDSNGNFLYAAWQPPAGTNSEDQVCLIAHADTIGNFDPDLRILNPLCVSEENWLVHNGGGYFDDRAGILGMIALLYLGVRPHIIITGLEEVGAIGADSLLEDFPTLEELFEDNKIQCLVELDRRGSLEAVFYDLEYPEFEKIFTRYFDKAYGTFTDICVLAPEWEIAAVNLSVGYRYEHTPAEILILDDFYSDITGAYTIIKDFKDYQIADRWAYKGRVFTPFYKNFMKNVSNQEFYDEGMMFYDEDCGSGTEVCDQERQV